MHTSNINVQPLTAFNRLYLKTKTGLLGSGEKGFQMLILDEVLNIQVERVLYL